MKKYIFLMLLILAMAPSVALASWWNPFSWFNNWTFNKKEATPQVQVINNVEPTDNSIQKIDSSSTISNTATNEVKNTSSSSDTTTKQEDKKENKELLPTSNLVTTNVDKKSSLSLIYPNGGESFKSGSDIKVKWEGSNVSNISFPILLIYYDKEGSLMTYQALGASGPPTNNQVYSFPANDYQAVIEIPATLQQVKNVYKVSKYKISIGRVPEDNDDSLPLDISDGFFTISRPPDIATQYATPSSSLADLSCTYKYQFGTENPEIAFEYGKSPCPLTSIDGSPSSCTNSHKVSGSQTYESQVIPDTTEPLFTKKFTIYNLEPNTKYNYQCVVKNSGGVAVGYGNMSPTTYVEFDTLP